MEFKELIAGFAAKYGIEGLSGADGAVELEVDDVRVELLDNPQTHSIFACAEIGHPPPDANGAFGAMMLQANFHLRATEGGDALPKPGNPSLRPRASVSAGHYGRRVACRWTGIARQPDGELAQGARGPQYG